MLEARLWSPLPTVVSELSDDFGCGTPADCKRLSELVPVLCLRFDACPCCDPAKICREVVGCDTQVLGDQILRTRVLERERESKPQRPWRTRVGVRSWSGQRQPPRPRVDPPERSDREQQCEHSYNQARDIPQAERTREGGSHMATVIRPVNTRRF